MTELLIKIVMEIQHDCLSLNVNESFKSSAHFFSTDLFRRLQSRALNESFFYQLAMKIFSIYITTIW